MTETPPHQARQQSVRRIMEAHSLDGILFTSLENIRYFCGFTGSDGALFLGANDSFFLTDSRYWTQADGEVRGSKIVHYKKKVQGIASLLLEQGCRRIGFESPALTISFHRALIEKLGDDVKLLPLEEELKNLRAVKDAEELALIRKAIGIGSRSFENAMMGMAKEGMVEREIALEMEFFMKRNGAEVIGFDIIVASGRRSALPHGKASDKKIEKGDLVLFDYGTRFQGYHSDETCTVACGHPSGEQKKIYQIVKDAHDKAIDAVRPGITFSEVDSVARDYIRNCGYGDYFGHGLGHGVGLAVHEDPAVNADNKGLAEEGMIFTIEPGIYIPDWGGVRIEDMVRVTSNGPEILTEVPKELRVI